MGITSAQVEGSVDPAGKDTSFYFEYLSDADFQRTENAEQRLTVSATGGTYTLTFDGQTTSPIAFDASSASVQGALQALSTIGAGNVAVSGGPGDEFGASPYTLAFQGSLAQTTVEQISSDAGGLTGGGQYALVEVVLPGRAAGFEGAAQAGLGSLAAGEPEAALPPTVLEGLSAATEYHLRLVASNEDGTDVAVAANFTTDGATPPSLSLDPATDVGYTTVHLAGSIDPEGGNSNPIGGPIPIGWELQVNREGNGWEGFAAGAIEGTDATSSAPIPVSADVTGLQNGADYKFRLRATYAGGIEALSSEDEFQTLEVAPPVAEVDDASLVSGTTAHFSGEVTAGSADPAFDANCQFDYVTDEQFQIDAFASAQSVACGPTNPVTGTSSTPVEADATGLEPHTVYHLRLRAENAGGPSVDEAAAFQTEPVAPSFGGVWVSSVATESARLNAEIDPGGDAATYHFEYLTLAAFEAAAPGEEFAGAVATAESGPTAADNQLHTASASLAGLAPDTAYRFRVVATNAKSGPGGTAGPVRAFHTAAAPVAAADTCPNAPVRAQQGSHYLPDCRAYELVNPPGRDYGDVMRMPSVGDDGEWTGFTTMVAGDQASGAQIASHMLAHRTPTGWEIIDSNASLDPFLGLDGVGPLGVAMYSADRSKAAVTSTMRMAPNDHDSLDAYLLDVGLGTTHWISQGPTRTPGNQETRIAGGNPDLSRVILDSYHQLLPEALPGGAKQLYAWEPGGLTLVSVLPNGDPTYGTPFAEIIARGLTGEQGFGSEAPNGGAHAVSEDAERIYFKEPTSSFSSARTFYVRDLAATPDRTVALSTSERAGDDPDPNRPYQEMLAANADGSVAYFASAAQLTDEATPGGGIYRFELDTPAGSRLTQITPPNGDYRNEFGEAVGLNVGTAILSADGSHLYFTSPAKLAPEATEGTLNAYVWSGGTTKHIATAPETAVARVSRDGRFALLQSSASIDGAPNDGHRAIYEYDGLTSELTCVSCRPDGSRSQGDASLSGGPEAPLPEAQTQPRNIADDGTVFFASVDRILGTDQNTVNDVYEYRNGELSLLTTGRSDRPSFIGDNSDDGGTVFLTTAAPLVGRDRDAGELDAYAVRVGGGFLEPPPSPPGCDGEACRGPASTPPPAGGAASEAVNGRPLKHRRKCAKGKVRRHGKCVRKKNPHRKHHKRHAQGDGRQGR
ncbi:MAG TPA: fibronectin type III domain-containing protein [Solirubrobacterales bacterium]